MGIDRRQLPLMMVLFAGPAVVIYLVQIQGFNFLDDGIWALGTQIVMRGGRLYRDAFSIYGPAKFYTLFPFFALFGSSVHTLAVFKAIVAGIGSVLGYRIADRYGAGRFAWLLPVGVVALGAVPPRYIAAMAFAAFHAEMLSCNEHGFYRGVLTGLAWGCLALFGLDMLVGGAVVVAAGGAVTSMLVGGRAGFPTRRVLGSAVGLVGVVTAFCVPVAASGYLGEAWWDTVVCPLISSPHNIGMNLVSGLFHPQGLDTTFSQVFTGEKLGPIWPGHTEFRAVAYLLMAIMVFVAPILVLFVRRMKADPRWGSLFGLALSGWVFLLWRNDVAHISAAFLGTLLFLVCLIGAMRRRSAVIMGLLLVVVLSPLAGEQFWLITHVHRESLVSWDRAGAGISMARSRRDILERVLQDIGEKDARSTLAWPALPGLVFLSGLPPASRQITLLRGSVRDPEAVIADLKVNKPKKLVLGRVAGLVQGFRSMQDLDPTIWAFLRSRYVIDQQVSDGPEGFQIISDFQQMGMAMPDFPLQRRLPGTSQLVKNGQTPALVPGVSIGQTMRVGGMDLHGLIFVTAATGQLPFDIGMVIAISELMHDGNTQPLARFEAHVTQQKAIQYCPLTFPAVTRTAGKMIQFEVTVKTDADHQIRFLWHQDSKEEDKPKDYYPDGHAVLNGKPVPADLFFISY